MRSLAELSKALMSLALAYAEYLGPADSTNTSGRRLTVLQRHLFRVLDLSFCTAFEAIGIHSLSPSSVYFDSEDTRYRAALSTEYLGRLFGESPLGAKHSN